MGPNGLQRFLTDVNELKDSMPYFVQKILWKTRNEQLLSGSQWVPMGPKGSHWVPKGPTGSQRVSMGPNESKQVFMDPKHMSL